MARLCWLAKLYTPAVLADIRARGGDGVANYVTSADGGSHFWARELDRYLETANRHHAMDSELRARLTSPDFDTFRQAVAEIKTAWFIERKTPLRLGRFRPAGADGRIGDFLAHWHRHVLFVEVKAPIREAPREGLWMGHDAHVVRNSVLSACDQIPNDSRHTLVILAGDLRLPMSSGLASGVLQALVGELRLAFSLQTGVGIMNGVHQEWSGDGVFQPTSNRHLSAVASLQEIVGCPVGDSVIRSVTTGSEVDWTLPEASLSYSFQIYHNPFALRPLPRVLFHGWEQWGPPIGNPLKFGRIADRRRRPHGGKEGPK